MNYSVNGCGKINKYMFIEPAKTNILSTDQDRTICMIRRYNNFFPVFINIVEDYTNKDTDHVIILNFNLPGKE